MFQLSKQEILAILRAADEIIGQVGRTMPSKILKGSRERKLLELEYNNCPTYGFFRSHSIENIMEKIDWMIYHDLLEIEFRDKLPMIVFTDQGWWGNRQFGEKECIYGQIFRK